MAFAAKNTVTTNPVTQPSIEHPTQSASSSELELVELEFLLRILKDTDLKGHQVEVFYNMIVKLQTLYLQKAKK